MTVKRRPRKLQAVITVQSHNELMQFVLSLALRVFEKLSPRVWVSDATRRATSAFSAALLCGAIAGCAVPATSVPAPPPLAPGMNILVVTDGLELLRIRASEPGQVVERKRLLGFSRGEQVAGISFRVARGILYALTTSGRLYTVDASSGIVSPVGLAPAVLPLEGASFGVDFNPLTDRIRVVSSTGQNLRMHPDTGATIDGDVTRPGLQGDTALAYVSGDPNVGRAPQVAALAFTPGRNNPQTTTLYAIAGAGGLLVRLGAQAAGLDSSAASSGELSTIGSLGLGNMVDATMDIADRDGSALAAVRTDREPRTVLVRIDLQTGHVVSLGTLPEGMHILGMAIEP